MATTLTEKDIELNFKRGLKDAEFAHRKYRELLAENEGQFVAIRDGNIVAKSTNMEELAKELEKIGENPNSVYIISFPPKDLVPLLY